MRYGNTPGKQVILNGNITLPHNKPNIERVLSATSVINITQTAVQENKVVFTGELIVDVQYVARVEGDTQPLHFFSFVVPFADFLVYDGLLSKVELNVEVEFQEYFAISDKELRKTVIILVFIKNEDSAVIESASDHLHFNKCYLRNNQGCTNTYTPYPNSCCYNRPVPCHQYSSHPCRCFRSNQACHIIPHPPHSCPHLQRQVCLSNQPHGLNPHPCQNAIAENYVPPCSCNNFINTPSFNGQEKDRKKDRSKESKTMFTSSGTRLVESEGSEHHPKRRIKKN